MDDYRSKQACVCGESDAACLEFHHRDESTKKFVISQRHNRSLTQLIEELAKCVPICCNCHRKGHAGRPRAEHAAHFTERLVNPWKRKTTQERQSQAEALRSA